MGRHGRSRYRGGGPTNFLQCMDQEVAQPGSAGNRATGPLSKEVPPRQRCAARSQSDPEAVVSRYSINSSAATSRSCGMVRPSVLAVFALISISNLVGT